MARREDAAICLVLLCCSIGCMRPAVAQVDAPEYATIAAALTGLRFTFYSAFLNTVANFTGLMLDPTTNVIMLVANNTYVQDAITDFNAQTMVQNPVAARAAAMFLMIPQPKGTINGQLNLTDGVVLNTVLTSSREYANTSNLTLSSLTFRDNGDGRWYVGGSPPGALLSLNNSHTAGNARLYVTEGLPVPPSQSITAKDSPAYTLSIAEALNNTKELSTYTALAQADGMVWSMFSDGNATCTTVFAAANSGWDTYFTSINTTLDAFKGTPAAHDLLVAGILVNRPYMVQQLPAGLTEARDLLGRTFQIASDGTPDPNNNRLSLIGSQNPSGVYIQPAPLRNIRGGKSILHATDVVLIPDNNTLPGAPGAPAPSPSPGAAPISGAPGPGQGSATGVGQPAGAPGTTAAPPEDSSSSNHTGLIVGLVVGITCGMALLALAVAFFLRRRNRPASKAAATGVSLGKTDRNAGSTEHTRVMVEADGSAVITAPPMGPHMDIPGVHKGMFTRMVAYEYSWTDMVPQPGQCMAVESGVNDRELDSLMKAGGAPQDCPVVKLSKEEVRDQVQLLRHGILGKGATAMVFQCVWPSRFGPNALLAAKVLKEGSDADPQHLTSFAYEASVLKSLLHPNVVRLYGYCLEPPCVCIILELLPLSLKQLLYDIEPMASALQSTPSGTASQNAAHGHAASLPSGSSLFPTNIQGLFATHTHGSDVHNSSNHVHSAGAPGGKHSAHSTEVVSGTGAKHSAHSVEVTIHEGGGDQPLTAARKLTMMQVLSISNDIAAGLAHMHNSNGGEVEAQSPFEEQPTAKQGTKVVHRDLKPANILINSRGQAKISDFGLARKHHQTTIGTAHLGAGTLPYMAPELLIHASAGSYATASATNRVDIYSLAMIMWEMLAGHTPWQGSADAALVIAVTQGRRPPLPEPPAVEPPLEPGLLQREAGPDVVPQFNAVVRACWRQRELKRPTAVAVHHKLCQLLTDMGVATTSQMSLPADEAQEQEHDGPEVSQANLVTEPTMSI